MSSFIELDRRFRLLDQQEMRDVEIWRSYPEALFDDFPGWSGILEQDRVVVLAEAGSGKTRELKEQQSRLVSDGKAAFYLALESLGHQSFPDLLAFDDLKRFEAWFDDGVSIAWFFLDSVDELKLTQSRFETALKNVSIHLAQNIHRARIVVSSRPTDWRHERDSRTFIEAFPTRTASSDLSEIDADTLFEKVVRHEENSVSLHNIVERPEKSSQISVYALLPLNVMQIEQFSKELLGDKATAFLEELNDRDASIFARRPLDLAELVSIWNHEGHLGNRLAQHELNTNIKLTDEVERPDSGVLSAERALVGAKRVALALALARENSLQVTPASVSVQDLPGDFLISRVLPDWTSGEIDSLLRRPVFDPVTFGRVKFHHRSVQEFLAAKRLRDLYEAGMPVRAIKRLLFAEKYGEHVVLPSMRPIAAWLSLWVPAVFEELVKREPESLLSHGDPESLDAVRRASVLRSIVQVHGAGGEKGIDFPLGEVQRFSSPDLEPVDRLKFKDSKKYKDRLSAAQKKTNEKDALIAMRGQLHGKPVVVCAFDFGFIGGSMGQVVGEKFVQAVNDSIAQRAPLVCFACSGGVRMQESLLGLMQMAKTSAALAKLSKLSIPYISVMVDPCTGGVSASLAMLGDINVAEPKALIGFAGPRVIEQTVRETLPEGFQRSEFLVEHGFIDMIVDRREMRDTISRLLNKLG